MRSSSSPPGPVPSDMAAPVKSLPARSAALQVLVALVAVVLVLLTWSLALMSQGVLRELLGNQAAEPIREHAQAFIDSIGFFALGVSLALILLASLLMREVRQAREREVRLARDRAALQAAYAEQAAAQASAERRAAQLQATLAGMSDGVMLLDADLRVVQWNDRFPAFTGVPLAVLREGQPMAELLRAQALAGEFGPGDVEQEVALRMQRLASHQSVGVHERTRPDGRTIEMRRAALPDGGFVTLYTDITARKQAEAAHAEARRLAEEAMEHKSRFVAIVSHEIRTPLNAVVNSLALLDQSGLNPAQHLLANTARQAGEALLDLVRDILDLTNAESGGLEVRPITFELRPLLEGAAEMFRGQATARQVRLVLDVSPEVPQAMRADRGRLRQVVMNLVSNAAKFANPGTVVIHAATRSDPDGPTLRIGVRDGGPRIPERDAAKLFQPFARLDNAVAGAASGTGLGLAICDRLMRLMGGRIGLATSPEGGNEFWLTLPLEAASAAAAVVPLPAPMPARLRRARILLVEDLAPNQLITAMLLRREGHRVDIADSGPAALKLVQTSPYDLIFMDLIMPGMNGYEATRRIRALPPPASAIPIIALTATTAPEDRARCLAVGMLDVVGKPVQPHELSEAVARAMRPLTAAAVPRVPGSAPPPAGPVLDTERLADLRRGVPLATLVPLVEQCLGDIRQRLPTLRTALGEGQFRPMEEQAHAIAGMAGNFGLAALEQRMRRIMRAARGQDRGAALAAAEDLDSELRRAGEALRLALRDAA